MVAGWYTAVVLFFHCCTNDPCDYGGDVGEKASEHFPAQEARAYFEQTAEDLRMVHIGCRHEHGDCGHGHGQSTKGILNEVEQAALMTPLWNDLRQTYENGKVVTLEVPLRVGGTPLKAWSPRKADGHAGSVDGSTVTMKLILQKNIETGNKRYFIATFIPDSSCYNKRKDMKTPYRFMRDRDYSGYVIISDVEGRYIVSFLHRNGTRQAVNIRQCTANDYTTDTARIIDRLYISSPIPSIMTRSSDAEEDETQGNYCALCGQFYYGIYCPNNCGFEVEQPTTWCSVCNFPTERCICCRYCGKHPCVCNASNIEERPLAGEYGKDFVCPNPNCTYGEFCIGICGYGSGGGTTESPGGGGGTTLPDNVVFTNVLNSVAKAIDTYSDTIISYLEKQILDIAIPDNLKLAGMIGPQTDLNGKIVQYRCRIHKATFKAASSDGKLLLVFHEIMHMIYWKERGYDPSKKDQYNDLHHQQMVRDPRTIRWLKALLPKYTDTQIKDAIRYVGTEASPIFESLPRSQRAYIEGLFRRKGIIFEGKAK